MKTAFSFVAFLCFLTAPAQKIAMPKALSTADSSLYKAIPAMAVQVLALYKDPNKQAYFDNLVYYQTAAGQYLPVVVALDSGDRAWGDTGSRAGVSSLQYRSYALAKEGQLAAGKPFPLVYGDTLMALYYRLPEEQREYATSFFFGDTAKSKTSLEELLKKHATSDSLSLDEARTFLKAYSSWTVDRQVQPIARPFFKAERDKKYITQDNVLIPMPDGAQLSATVVRRVKDPTPLPVVLMYNIYSDKVGEDYQSSRATEAAERGYASVIVNTRGKKGSPQAVEPFEHDAQDAYYAIDWISKQPWCNGKIGMYGGSYLGFSQWSATKKLHPALKTIVPQVAVGAGVDVPYFNGVFMSYMLRWIHYVSNHKGTDHEDFRNQPHWDSLYLKWYKSGRPFRALDTMEGRPNAIFQRWLKHPAQDKFWQDMVPYGKEFASINIPILTTTGYFDDDQRGAFYYLQEHLKWNKGANHYLVIGPWNHGGGQGFTGPVIGSYQLDSVGFVNVNQKAVFPWFDHFLKDSAFPSFLKDKVTFQVAGANEWRSASSLKATSNDSMVLYLSNVRTVDGYKLTARKPSQKNSVAQEINYTGRERIDPNIEGADVMPMDTAIYVGEDLTFMTEPLASDAVMSGSMQGAIKAVLNKKDMDINIRLYQLTPEGKYYLLSRFWGRASYLKDRSKRQLLKPGVEETIPVNNAFYTCRKMTKGSRIVAYVGILKSPGWELNYGTGKDVSSETIADGKVPLQIQWMNSSYLKIPLLR